MPTRLPPEQRRAQLAAAAMEVFAHRPETDVGLEDLAAAAGVTRNLVYRYFASRAELHQAAVLVAVGRLAERFDTDPGHAVGEKVPHNIAVWLDGVASQDPAVLLLLRAARSSDPGVAELAARARDVLAGAIARNHLGSPADPQAAVLAALDGYLALADRLIDRWREGALTRGQVEDVLAGVLPPLIAAAR